MNFDEALAYLLSLGHETLTMKLGLRNIETLLRALDDPQKQFPAIQIAGTNGKGSTAVMIDSICRAASIRAGLFTSPHLNSITERIKIGGERISKSEFARLTFIVSETAKELVRHGELETLPTFFEHVTAIALLAFRDAKVELAILETGLGGRLDSTTAARAGIVAITSIGMDHEEYLGHTIREIAAEKAAIIRPGVTAVVAPQSNEASEVIRDRCQATDGTPLIVRSTNHRGESAVNEGEAFCTAYLDEVTSDGRCRVTFETPHRVHAGILLGLRGRHQIDNAAVAVALAEVLRDKGFKITDDAIRVGLETATHAGRLEMFDHRPPVLFDGAHNSAAAQALAAYVDEFVRQPITMIFGAMKDKQLNEMAGVLFPKATNLILTELDNPRAATVDLLTAAVPVDFPREKISITSTIQQAFDVATSLTPANGLICVTGSLYLIGAAREIIRQDHSLAHQPS